MSSAAFAQTLASRAVPPTSAYSLPAETEVIRLVVKFHEGTRVRLRNGLLKPLMGNDREQGQMMALGLDASRLAGDLATCQQLITSAPQARGMERLFQANEEVLARRRQTGEARSGKQLADLDLYYEVKLEPDTSYGQLTKLLEALNTLASVEIAYAEAPSRLAMMDIPPTTPNLTMGQGYLNPAPLGIDARYAWTQPGGRGEGAYVVDVECAWKTGHEDMPVTPYQGGVPSPSLGLRNHGTAVLGEIAGIDNGYGVTGIAHLAQIGVESIQNCNYGNLPDHIISAAEEVGEGGIVLIELGSFGPSTHCDPCSGNQCGVVPVEHIPAGFDAITNASANGTVVIEVAGNGGNDLDDPVYGGLFDRTVRDSGAILVAASESTGRTPACFTNFGDRIDVHAWGENVVTLGYGDHPDFPSSDENQFYTARFGGTSSAAPMVAGAVANIQGIAQEEGLGTLAPLAIRLLLASTGTPQIPGPKNIGPMPDLKSAIVSLCGGNQPPQAEDNAFTTPQDTRLTVFFEELLANDDDPDGDTVYPVWGTPRETTQGGILTWHLQAVTYDPPSGFEGTDSFEYTITDRLDNECGGLTGTGTVTISVTPSGDLEPPRMYVDRPAHNEAVSGDFLTLGWATDASGVSSVTFAVDGIPVQLTGFVYGTLRAGVCTVHSDLNDPNCPFVGWQGILDTTQFSNGSHTLRVIATDAAPVPNTATLNRSFTIENTNATLKVGTETIDDVVATVPISGFTNPIVVMGPPSFNDADPVVTCLDSVSSSSFRHFLQEWDYLDGNHGTETAGYLVLEAGTSTLGNLPAEAGLASVGTGWTTVSFSQSFANPPVVLTQVAPGFRTTISAPPTAVAIRVKGVTAGGFQVRLQEEEGADGIRQNETVHYIAIAEGSSTIDGRQLLVSTSGDRVRHDFTTLDFGTTITNPVFLAGAQTTDGGDPAAIRHRNLNSTSVEVKMEEEQSADAEVRHTTENVGYVVISN